LAAGDLSLKEGGLYYTGRATLVFIRNGANLAHFFRQMPKRNRNEEKIQNFSK
jgi:hypothetical protein